MKKFVRVIALVCALVMVLCMCGCTAVGKEERARIVSTMESDLNARDGVFLTSVDCDRHGNVTITCTCPTNPKIQQNINEFTALAREMAIAVDGYANTAADYYGFFIKNVTIYICDTQGNLYCKTVNGHVVD